MSALAHPTRYRCFQLLVEKGEVAAGEIAEALGTPASLLSSHLSILAKAGFVTSSRSGRSIVYSANQDQVRELISHLTALSTS